MIFLVDFVHYSHAVEDGEGREVHQRTPDIGSRHRSVGSEQCPRVGDLAFLDRAQGERLCERRWLAAAVLAGQRRCFPSALLRWLLLLDIAAGHRGK